ncbi:MAG: hypothetical protein AB7G17_10705 [Phycisphaerales bacterium]
MIRHCLVCAGALAGLASVAAADTVLAIDINGLTVQSVDSSNVSGAFGGLTHTGALVISHDANAILAGVSIDGINQPKTPGLGLTASGRIDLNAGNVVGGFFNVLMSDGSGYSASIVSGVGKVTTQAGQGFKVDGLTFNVLFSDSGAPGMIDRFAGVDISMFTAFEPLFGSFLQFAFSPDATGHDADSDLDLVVSVPLPGSAGLATLGLLGLASRRRR